jgi:hypothetical protein
MKRESEGRLFDRRHFVAGATAGLGMQLVLPSTRAQRTANIAGVAFE